MLWRMDPHAWKKKVVGDMCSTAPRFAWCSSGILMWNGGGGGVCGEL